VKAQAKSGATVQWTEESLFDTAPMTNDTLGSSTQIDEVFEYWIDLLWNGKGVRPVLSDKRRKKILAAIKLYGVAVCKQAVLGCTMSEWHMGNNPSGKKYTDIELILRDPEHIERFVTQSEEDEF
jgi:hypothetical protein